MCRYMQRNSNFALKDFNFITKIAYQSQNRQGGNLLTVTSGPQGDLINRAKGSENFLHVDLQVNADILWFSKLHLASS